MSCLAVNMMQRKLKVEFPQTYMGKQFETIAKLMATRKDRGVDKDFFYVAAPGFDIMLA